MAVFKRKGNLNAATTYTRKDILYKRINREAEGDNVLLYS